MKIFKPLFDFNKASLALLILPYIGFNWVDLYHSPVFNIKDVFILFSAIVLAEVFFKLTPINKKNQNYTHTLIITSTLIVFYGYYLVSFLQNVVGLNIRGRLIIETVAIILLPVVYFFNSRIKTYKTLNIYFLIFGIVTTIGQLASIKNKSRSTENIHGKYLNITSERNETKPVILIITDEYTSPNDLFKATKDSTVFDFSRELKNNKWIINNAAYSYDTSTIHSLSSMFNFNLSTSGYLNDMPISEIVRKKLIHARLYDSLQTKKVKTINYGIFNFGKYAALNKLLLYPNNFYEEFFYKSSIYRIIYGTGKFDKNGFQKEYSSMEIHNKFILESLENELHTMIGGRYFVYVHLFMPHGPYIFKPQFRGGPINLKNYLDYWKFTNEKLKSLIDGLAKNNKYKIIITGDHGFRNQSTINPHNTFTAFYGFNQQSIDSIKSVQDIGNLINASF